jgi:hypothetical protein
MAAQQQQMEMQRTLFDQQQQAMQAQQQRGQEVQSILASMIDDYNSGAMTAEKFAEYQLMIPEMQEDLQAINEGLTSRQREGMVLERTRLAMALVNDPPLAKSMIDKMQMAAENSGNEADAAFLQAMGQTAESEPAAALFALAAELGVLMEPKQHEAFMSAVFPEQFRPLTAEEVDRFRASGFDLQPGQSYQINERTGEVKAFGAERGPLVQMSVGADGRPYQYMEQVPDGMVIPKELLGGYSPGTDRIAIRDSGNPQGFREEIVTGSTTDLAQKQRALNTGNVGGVMFEDINFALDYLLSGTARTGPFVAGLLGRDQATGVAGIIQGAVRENLPETVALDQVLSSIRSNVTVQEMQRAREASPTGGLMGNMSERQSDMIGELLGQLKLDLPREVLIQNLIRLQNLTMDSVHGTPAEIAELVRQGKIDPELGKILSYRTPTTYSAAPAGMRRGQRDPVSAQNIQQMSAEQLSGLDVNEMNADQLRSYLARMRQLGAQ